MTEPRFRRQFSDLDVAACELAVEDLEACELRVPGSLEAGSLMSRVNELRRLAARLN